jgi:peptide/nickel transport system substrate-binding protein
MSLAEIDRRVLLRNAAYASAGLLLIGACTSDGKSVRRTGEEPVLGEIEGGEVVTDQAKLPTSFQESPEFAKLVAAGKLPNVAERIGQDPLIIKPVHEIGKYGGQIRRGFSGVSDPIAAGLCAGPDTLLYWDHRHENVVPNIARAFEMSPDFREVTLHLRRGMKWSDGRPLTADDVLFWRNDLSLNKAVGRGSPSLRLRGRDVVVEKVDDFTVRYRCPAPYALLPELLAGQTDIGGHATRGPQGGGGFAPKHYLSRFHPKYTSEAAANALAREAGMPHWSMLLLNRNTWFLNPELPTVTPWIVSRPINQPPFEFTANPYSIWVDTAGNQLPYIPKISMSPSKDTEVVTLRTISGQFDFQDRGLQVDKLPVLMQNQERGNYTVHRSPGDSVDCAIRINLAYDKDPAIGDLLRTVEFRRALALAVDRNEINQTFFLGSGIPTATMPAKTSPYHPGDEWQQKWATYDVAQANQLLDQIGLTKKDGSGYRLHPSGKGRLRLDIQSGAIFANYPAVGEMIRKQWIEIGIDVTSRSIAGPLLVERTLVNDLMLTVHTVASDDPFTNPDVLLPTVTNNYSGMIGIPYAKWFASGGKDGTEPPESMRLLKDGMSLLQRGLEVDKASRAPLGQQLFKLHADQVWTIGLVGFGLAINGIYCASNKLGNVPDRILNNTPQRNASNALPMAFYYK